MDSKYYGVIIPLLIIFFFLFIEATSIGYTETLNVETSIDQELSCGEEVQVATWTTRNTFLFTRNVETPFTQACIPGDKTPRIPQRPGVRTELRVDNEYVPSTVTVPPRSSKTHIYTVRFTCGQPETNVSTQNISEIYLTQTYCHDPEKSNQTTVRVN